MEHLLDRALAADPAARFPDAATFGAEIRNVLGDLSVAVGASDLAALLGLVTAPRSGRTLMMERSKVIRLGPEAEALKQAIAAPATPAPVLTNARGKTVNLADPGPTPPARSFTPGRTPVARNLTPPRTPTARSLTPGRTPVARNLTPARTPAARSLTPGRTPAARNLTPPRTPAARAPAAPAPARPAEPRASGRPAPDPMATPPPTTPLPPARARGHTPLKSANSELTPRATPPRPQNVEGRNPTMLGRPAPNRQQSQPGAQQWPIPGSSQSSAQSSAQSTMRGPTPAAPPAVEPDAGGGGDTHPQPSPAGSRQTGPRDEVQPGTPAYGVQRPPQRDFALAQTMLPHGGVSPGAMGGHPIPVSRQHHETARVQYRPQRQWGGVFTVIVLLLVAAGVGVHLWFIPLDVLITWRQPTGLSITTEPPGAKLRVDGVPLATRRRPRSPSGAIARITSSRRRWWAIRLARETIRYDKSATLSYVVRLLKDPNYIPPPPPPAGGPAAPSTGPPR